MKIHDLIEHFSNFTSVPVDPNDVAQQISAAGIRDEINFIDVDINTRILRGALVTTEYRNGLYADPILCSDIYISVNQSQAWRRLVAIKELLHVLDGPVSQTSTLEDFEKLIMGLCTPLVPGSIDIDSLQVLGDRLMVYYAVAIIFPSAARNILLNSILPLSETLEEYAARILDVPLEIANLVLSTHWPNVYILLTGKK